MKIHILCGSGSPNGVGLSDLHGVNGRPGVGGSEYALLTLCEAWSKAGHEVALFNNPKRQDGVFEQRSVSSFSRDEQRDVLIVFREPTPLAYKAKGEIIFWSCDQYTSGDFAHFSKFANKIVTISPFHTEYFLERYGIKTATDIDLPIRTWEYAKTVEKVKNRLIFTSVPDRGLDVVANTFHRIRNEIPDASLVITSDYRLWGSSSPNNQDFVRRFMREANVQFLGAVPRERLVREQLSAQIHYYPCTYEELFCISVAESQVAGVLPITTPIGAVGTTNMGVIINGDATESLTQDVFVQKTIEYLRDPELPNIQKQLRESATERFSVERILKEWNTKVFDND